MSSPHDSSSSDDSDTDDSNTADSDPNQPDTDQASDPASPSEPARNRYTASGRGPSDGDWLEHQTTLALERWEYRTQRNSQIFGVEADIAASRRDPRNDPSDYLVVECKDWADRPIPEEVIFRLVTLAFTARAMPVLVTTTELSKRAVQISQAWDVRVLDLEDLQATALPPLTEYRVPPDAEGVSDHIWAVELRGFLPRTFTREGLADVEAPVFDTRVIAPCYVPDRDGHTDYVFDPSRE